MTFLANLAVAWMLFSFRLVLEGKAGKEISESSRFQFLEKFLANSCALKEIEYNTPGWLNIGDIADLPLLGILLVIRQKSQEPSFWELIASFVLLAKASLAASRTLLQQLLACLILPVTRSIYLAEFHDQIVHHSKDTLNYVCSLEC